MDFHLSTDPTTPADGVVERAFTVGDVPGVLWSPAVPVDGAPLLLTGHGGGLHVHAPGVVARAVAAVRRDGFHVAAVNAPGHGGRPRSDRDAAWVAELGRARRAGRSLAPVVVAFNASLAERHVPEWRATIDALHTLPEIDPAAPIGYAGTTLAAMIGIPLVAAEPRIGAAVLGGAFASPTLLGTARSITVPVQYLLPWDDPEIDRESGLALFDAFGSEDKLLLAFPGSHRTVPGARIDTGFFRRALRT
ncbi:alpha/beta hydrolase [Jatrophihabitans sp. YIM 134969]